MLLGDDDGASLGRGTLDGIAVQRLNGVDIDDAHRNTLGFQGFVRANGFCHEKPGGDNRHIRSLNQLDRLADLELLVRGIHDRRLHAPGPNENRAHVLDRAKHQRGGRDFVGRRNDHEAGQGTGQRRFFHAHL